MRKLNLPLPPCPCPVCGQVHSHFVHGSQHSVRGAGRGSLPRPHDLYKSHLTEGELESAIYGPLTQKICPDAPCRVVSVHDIAAAHGVDPSDIALVRSGHKPVVPAELAGFVPAFDKNLLIGALIGAALMHIMHVKGVM